MMADSLSWLPPVMKTPVASATAFTRSGSCASSRLSGRTGTTSPAPSRRKRASYTSTTSSPSDEAVGIRAMRASAPPLAATNSLRMVRWRSLSSAPPITIRGPDVDPELETGMTPQASRCQSGPVQDQGSTDAPARRRVAVMRHGKAEQAGRTDFERELAERVGWTPPTPAPGWPTRGSCPTCALVSAARRTIGTWESVAAGGGFDVEPRLSQVLYGAGPETCLDLVRELPADATSLILVGHNPTMAYLASLLDDGEGDPAVSADMMSGYPTERRRPVRVRRRVGRPRRGRRPPRGLPRRPGLNRESARVAPASASSRRESPRRVRRVGASCRRR